MRSSRLLPVFLFFLVLFGGVSEAFAGPAGGMNAGPSSGTVVAAAMETAGYVSQAKILKDLKNMLEGLGGLVYLCVILSALVTTALSGRYMTALWLLVGPPMFFFLIRAESPAAGVEWQFGSFRDQGDLQKILRGAAVQQGTGDNVSNVFHEYNVLVSNLYQQLIKLITNDSTRQQMKFMARAKIIDELFATRNDEPGLDQLTRITFTACQQPLSAARLVALGQRDPSFRSRPEYEIAVREYCDLYPVRDINFPDGPAKVYVKLLLNIPSTSNPQRLNQVSCQDLFGWLYLGAVSLMRNELTESINRHISHQAPAVVRTEVVNEIAAKLTTQSPYGVQLRQSFSCTGTGNTAPGTQASATTDGLEAIPVIFASWLLRRGMFEPQTQQPAADGTNPAAAVQPASLGGSHYQSDSRSQGQGVVRRFKSEQLAESAKYEVFILAKMLPYMQGAGLYILATIYPFFCLLVLLPGQAGGFLTWLALWAWLKSWDVGWALVYVADELLWTLMPHRSYYRMAANAGAIGGASSEPVTVLEAAFSGDYSYSLATYWVLLAGLMSSVPIMTAHAVLGSKKAIAGMFVDGAKSIGQVFSKAAGDWVAMEQLGEVDRRIQQRALFSQAVPQILGQHRRMLAMTQAQSGGLQRRIDAARMSLAAAGFINNIPGGAAIQTRFQNWVNAAPAGPARQAREQWAGLLPNPTQARAALDSLLTQQAEAQAAMAREFGPGNTPPSGQEFSREIDAEFRRLVGAGDTEGLGEFLSTIGNYVEEGRQPGGASLATQLAALHSDTPPPLPENATPAQRTAREQRVARLAAETPEQRAARRARAERFERFNVDRFDFGAPTMELERLARTIHEQHMSSQLLAGLGGRLLELRNNATEAAVAARVFGSLSTSAAAAANRRVPGLFRAFSGAVGTGGGNVAFEAQRLYQVTQSLGLELDRKANAASATYLSLCSSHYYYQAARSDEYANYERIRAGLTNRAEWWGVPDSPHTLANQADLATAELSAAGRGWMTRLEITAAQGGVNIITDSLGHVFRSSVTNGRR